MSGVAPQQRLPKLLIDPAMDFNHIY